MDPGRQTQTSKLDQALSISCCNMFRILMTFRSTVLLTVKPKCRCLVTLLSNIETRVPMWIPRSLPLSPLEADCGGGLPGFPSAWEPALESTGWGVTSQPIMTGRQHNGQTTSRLLVICPTDPWLGIFWTLPLESSSIQSGLLLVSCSSSTNGMGCWS